MEAGSELSSILQRRQTLNDALDAGDQKIEHKFVKVNVYVEFKEFSRKQIKEFNSSNTGRLSLEELKIMMEKLGSPQTHLGLKAMIQVKEFPKHNLRRSLLLFRIVHQWHML